MDAPKNEVSGRGGRNRRTFQRRKGEPQKEGWGKIRGRAAKKKRAASERIAEGDARGNPQQEPNQQKDSTIESTPKATGQ